MKTYLTIPRVYPTEFFNVNAPIVYGGFFATPSYGTFCCEPGVTTMPMPASHYPFPSSTGSTNTADPSGWLYNLTSYYTGYTGYGNVSSLLAPATINTVTESCPHPLCVAWRSEAAASAVSEAGALLATSTVHVTGTFSSTGGASATPVAHAQSVPSSSAGSSSVKVDPITASPTGQKTSSPSPDSSTVQAQPEVSGSSEQNSPASTAQETPTSTANPASILGSILGHHATTTVSTSPAPAPALSPGSSITPPHIVVGSNTVSANSASHFIVSGQTLAPGSSITIGSGTSATVVALQTSGSSTQLIVGSSTSPIAAPLPVTQQVNSASPPPVVVGSSTITANSASQYVVSGQTLAPGSSLTLGSGSSTIVVGLETSASKTYLIIGSSISQISMAQSTALVSEIPAPITVGSAVVTPNTNSEYVIGSETLSPGGSPITISGTPYSLASGATELVIGTTTEVLTTGAGMGSYIWSGLGGAPTASASTAAEGSTTDSGEILSGTAPAPSSVSAANPPGTSQSAPQTTSKSDAAGLWLNLIGMFLCLLFTVIILK